MSTLKLVVFSLFIVSIAKSDNEFDCKIAKFTLNYARNCRDGSHIITILDNSSITMDDTCELYTDMCSYLIEYHTASFEVSISKDDVHHFGDKVDLCHKPKKAHNLSKIAMSAFSIPYVCPVASNYTSCGHGKKIFSTNAESKKVVKELWANGGVTKIYADIVHDTGKSCMEAELKISME